MANGKTQTVLDLWDKLTTATEVLRKIHAKQVAAYNLTAPQFHVLEVLYKEGSVPLKRISERLFVTGANITCVMDNLEKEELVRRVPSRKDRRVINAELTSRGEERIKKIYPEYTTGLEAAFKSLNETDKKELIKLLSKAFPQ